MVCCPNPLELNPLSLHALRYRLSLPSVRKPELVKEPTRFSQILNNPTFPRVFYFRKALKADHL